MTFLELVQQVAEESGTGGTIGNPSAVTGQTGRNLRFVNWTARAWTDIQRSRQDWRWMETEFSGPTVASQRAYTAAQLGISSRFARWIHHDEDGADTFSLYLPADGQSTEGYLRFLDWPDFRRVCEVGSSATKEGKPVYITVKPDRSLALYPTPDAIYTLRGRYRKSAQTLAADADEPEMPEDYHPIIAWRALDRMSTFDESMVQKPIFGKEYQRILTDLVIDQTPRLRKPEPLA